MKFKSYEIELLYENFPLYSSLSKEDLSQSFMSYYNSKYPKGFVYKRSDKGVNKVSILRLSNINHVFKGIIDAGTYPYKPPLTNVETLESRENPKEDEEIEPEKRFLVLRFNYLNNTPIKIELFSNKETATIKAFMRFFIKDNCQYLFYIDENGNIKKLCEEFNFLENEEEDLKKIKVKLNAKLFDNVFERIKKATEIKKIFIEGTKGEDSFSKELMAIIGDNNFKEEIIFKVERNKSFPVSVIERILPMVKDRHASKFKVEIKEDNNIVILDLLNLQDFITINVQKDKRTGLYNEEEVFRKLLEIIEW